ncbi:MAG: hypothetical protein WCO52_01690 [bacterium]
MKHFTTEEAKAAETVYVSMRDRMRPDQILVSLRSPEMHPQNAVSLTEFLDLVGLKVPDLKQGFVCMDESNPHLSVSDAEGWARVARMVLRKKVVLFEQTVASVGEYEPKY